jgi:hypothetical protein
MATLAEFLFEGAAGDGFNTTVGGGGVIDTVVFAEGVQSYYLDCTGAAKGHNYSVAAGKRIIVGRFYYRIKTDTSGTATIIQGDNTSGSCQISARVGRKLRVQVVGGTASVDSAALNLNQWYLIDFKFDTSTGTTSIAWSINGAAQTGATRVQTAADTTSIRLGNTGTNTYQANFDAFKLTDQAADYPLGGITRQAPAGNAAGTGAAGASKDTIAPTGGNAAGTGAAQAATTKIAPVVAVASGAGAALDATVTAEDGAVDVDADAGHAAGTGAASGVTAAVAPTSGASSGAGAALTPSVATSVELGTFQAVGIYDEDGMVHSVAVAPTAGIASGAGTASDATISQTSNVSAAAGHASGTGTAPDVQATGETIGGSAAGTGTSANPSASIAPVVGAASATGSAADATVATAGVPVAGTATGTGEAFAPSAGIAATSDVATGTGQAFGVQASTTDEAPGDTAQGTGTASDPTTSVAPVVDFAAATGTAYDATATSTGVGQATAEAAAGTGAAFDASTTSSVVPVVPTGTSTAGKYRRRRPTDEFGYPTDMVWKEPPPLDRKPVLVMADIARGDGTAFAATTEWDDDESALLLLLGIAA